MPESIQTSELRSKLVKYAGNILSKRPYFRHQLRQKLLIYKEKFVDDQDSQLVDEIILQLSKSGYLDDKYLTQAYIRRQLSKCYGPKIIRYKLKLLGVPQEMVNSCLVSEATPEAIEAAVAKLKTKFRAQDQYKLRQKLYQRGF